MTTATLTKAGTYEGKTAAEWRAESAAMFAKREESYERSDTDGFLSQWALGSLSQDYTLRAQLAEANGLTEVCALFDLDGQLVPSIHGWGEYGEYFAVLDNDERGCRRFFNPSKARNEETARKNNAAKGFYIGTVKTQGKVKMLGGGTGLSGCASSYNAIVPQTLSDNGGTLITDEQVVEIIDNGHEVPAASAAAREIHEALTKAAANARTTEATEILTDAADFVLGGHYEAARKMLAQLRTRASRAAIAALKAL